MMNFKNFLSLFLAVLMLCGGLTNLVVIPASAAEETTETGTGEEETLIDYKTEVFASPEDKLGSMKLMTTKGNFSIYADQNSGEVAVKDLSSGQILFTNPYDVGVSTASETIKNELLSQIIVKFTENGRAREYTSYEYAATKGQIKVKNIKSGIRVEYTIGREEARRLVPRMIERSRFEELILGPIAEGFGISYDEALKMKEDINYVPPGVTTETAFYFNKIMCYYVLVDLDAYTSDSLKQDKLENYPIISKMDIYILDTSTTATEIDRLEENIKTYCSDYSYEEMDYDHNLTQYTSEDENPPLFKLALEYTLDELGMTVRLPTNGLRFNESKFQITDISVLPYMGAGNNAYNGYTFYPDGSGALFAFEDLADQNTYSVAGKIYGVDYAYHKISGTYQQTVRYPVFGVMEETRYYDCVAPDEDTGEDKTTTISGVIFDAVTATNPDGTTVSAPAGLKTYQTLVNSSDVEEYTVSRGYVAIIEEGDALTNLVNYHAGVLSPYDTVQMNFSPRPQDSYNIADAISVGTNSEWTVVSERKYVGNYKIRYIMLTDEQKAADNNLANGSWYEASWLGMAKAYRDYLVGKGVLTQISDDQVTDNIPLYIESFGAMETIEKILSIPVEVTKPLTSAKDITTMFEELSAEGVKNINFKLTGFANGGMYATMPYGLKWEKAVSEDMDMQELFDYAADVTDGDLGLYPDFDFSYVMMTGMFDGFSMRKHAVRTIDDRYSYKREYIATQQRYAGYYQLAVSPAYYSRFYEKLMEKYLTYNNVEGISVGSLGNALNSDFDEDEPYNREDSKSFVSKALDYISGSKDGNLEVMVDGGNAYTWKYADHILGAALDSSRYIKASYSVPFVGVVLHGYKNFTGSPLNMEGDVNYAKLKAIENGASVYFTLSYQNTQNMKEDFYLNRYYSVRYDIWFDDVVEIYNELNAALSDVQNKVIIDHEFLSGMRVPDTNELDRDITEEFEAVLDFQNNKAEYEEKQKAEAVADARDKIASVESTAKNFIDKCLAHYSGISGAAYMFVTGNRSMERRFASYYEAKAAYDKVMAEYEAADDATKKEMASLVANAEATHRQALGQLRTYIRNIGRAINTIQNEYDMLNKLLQEAQEGSLLINSTEGCPSSIITEIEIQLANTEKYMNEELGINFKHTVDNAEVGTFLNTHVATLIFSCYGENNHADNGIIGKAQSLYEMLAGEKYGLQESEMDLLRYLPANRDLSDSELMAKYTIKEDSMGGLIKYVKELLGENYKFDPVVEGMENGVEDNIRDYFEYLLYNMITGLSDGSILPTLNFNSKRIDENGREQTAGPNNKVVIGLIDKEITAALLASGTAFANVVDGNYDLDTLYTEAQLNELLDKCVKIIEDNTRTQLNPNPETPVDYLTPDTMRYDLTQYIRSYYYRAAIEEIAPDNGEVTLLIQTVSYQTDSSMGLLVSLRNEAYGKVNEENEYAEMLAKMESDTEVENLIGTLNEILKPAYGDVSNQLMDAFRKTFAERLVGTDKAPTMAKASRVDPADEEKKINLRDEASLLKDRITSNTTYAEALALVDELIATCGLYEMDEDYNVEYASSNYIFYYYLKAQAEKETDNFYFDEQMSKMDAAVRASVEERKNAILAALPEGFGVYDLYDAVINSIADPENSVKDFAKAQAGAITHTSREGSLETDIQKYYLYRLFNAFEGYELTEAPTITIDSNDKANITNALKVVDNDLKDRIPELLALAKSKAERGTLPNYALTGFLTAEEIEAIGNDLVDDLIEALYAKESDRATLAPRLLDYFKHKYTAAVTALLFDDKLPTFSVSEVYGNTLQDSVQGLEDILYYYVTTFTDMTAEDIENLTGGGSFAGGSEDEDEASRYLSDDGRIVSVTYGDQNADGSYSAYKTFILNYNNFSVNVEYADVTYTIPAYGYVIVMH